MIELTEHCLLYCCIRNPILMIINRMTRAKLKFYTKNRLDRFKSRKYLRTRRAIMHKIRTALFLSSVSNYSDAFAEIVVPRKNNRCNMKLCSRPNFILSSGKLYKRDELFSGPLTLILLFHSPVRKARLRAFLAGVIEPCNSGLTLS